MKHRNPINLILSQYFICLLSIVLLVLCFAAPKLVPWFAMLRGDILIGREPLLFITVYASVLPAAVVLYCLYRLLKNIGCNIVFTLNNVALLGHIANCCTVETVILVFSALYYPSFGIIGILAAFMSLILRVVAAVFQQAVVLKEDNDLTV